MADYITYQSPNGWAVLTSDRVYCFNATKPQAIAAIVAAGLEVDESAFANPADLSTYKATLQAATQSTLAFVEMQLEGMTGIEAVAKLQALLTLTADAASSLAEAIERENDLAAEQLQLAKAEADRIEAAKRAEADRIEAEKQAKAERQAAAKAEEIKRLKLRFDVDAQSGEVTLSASALDPRYPSARRIVKRWKNADAMSPAERAAFDAR